MENLYYSLDPESDLAWCVLGYLTNPRECHVTPEEEEILVKAANVFSPYGYDGHYVTALELYFDGLITWNEVLESIERGVAL